MSLDPDETHYRALGLARGASNAEIRAAHRRLAWSLHPDRYADRPETERRFAEERMRAVNQAWTVLGNPDRRAEYDELLRASAPPRQSAPPADGGIARSATTSNGFAGDEQVRRTAPGDPSRYERFDADPAWRRSDGSVRLGADEPDGVWVSPAVAFLIRRGPLLAVLALAAALFVGTAYAGRDRWDPPRSTTTTVCVEGNSGLPIGAPDAKPC